MYAIQRVNDCNLARHVSSLQDLVIREAKFRTDLRRMPVDGYSLLNVWLEQCPDRLIIDPSVTDHDGVEA